MLLIPLKYLRNLLQGHEELVRQSLVILLIVLFYGTSVVFDQRGSEVFIEVI